MRWKFKGDAPAWWIEEKNVLKKWLADEEDKKPTQEADFLNGILESERAWTFFGKSVAHPPLGIIPKKLHNEARLKDIHDAIGRYLLCNKDVPAEWLKEKMEIENGL